MLEERLGELRDLVNGREMGIGLTLGFKVLGIRSQFLGENDEFNHCHGGLELTAAN